MPSVKIASRPSRTLCFAKFLHEDRLGSATDARLLPYGEEISTTPNERVKFATYQRDETGVDYADQRYYQPGNGRFLTPDPFGGSAKASAPGSWNRYAYVEGDPVNAHDPDGLCGVLLAGINTADSDPVNQYGSETGSVLGYGYGAGMVRGAARWAANAVARTTAAEVAYVAIMEASKTPGWIDVVAYSGGANAFNAALGRLQDEVVRRIRHVTYLSPGGGTLASGFGETTIITGNGIADTGLGVIGTYDPGTTFIRTNCGHEAACLLEALRANGIGEGVHDPCESGRVFTLYDVAPDFLDRIEELQYRGSSGLFNGLRAAGRRLGNISLAPSYQPPVPPRQKELEPKITTRLIW